MWLVRIHAYTNHNKNVRVDIHACIYAHRVRIHAYAHHVTCQHKEVGIKIILVLTLLNDLTFLELFNF